MADDDAYAAFLNKASDDAQPAHTSSAPPKAQTITTASVHPALTSLPAERVYVSDADEPFRPVSIPFDGKLDAAGVAAAVKDATGAQLKGVEQLSVHEWDPRGEYKDVVGRVAEAAGCGEGEVVVFRAPGGGARVEYWVLGHHAGESGLRGFVATGVES